MKKNEDVDRLRAALLQSMRDAVGDSLKSATDAIHDILECAECSLWSINENAIGIDGVPLTQKKISSSLIYRKKKNSVRYDFVKDEDYVHDLNDCFFKKVIEGVSSNDFLPFHCNEEDALRYNYRSPDFINAVGIKSIVSIPIKDKENHDKIISILELSYLEECEILFTESNRFLWYETSTVISDFFSAVFYRYAIMQKQLLMEAIIDKREKFKNSDIKTLFRNILVKIVNDSCKCQGASFFMWDSYQNQYNLIATTPNDTSDVYYRRGEGITGHIGVYHHSYISNDVQNEPLAIWRWGEVDMTTIKTAMFIPVTHPSIDDEVIGILRFVNKKNQCNETTIDCFNDADIELLNSTLKYLSLIIDFYLKEEEQSNFISKMSHELMTPTSSILKTADRLYKNLGDPSFLQRNLASYLCNIIDFANFQKWQVSTSLFLSKDRRKQPLHIRYSIKAMLLSDIIHRSKQFVIPIARKYHVRFDNINIDPSSNQCLMLKVDENAFLTVFYNLFTNAIKYHDRNNPEEFYIAVSYQATCKEVEISIEDFGIGIAEKDKEAIFQVGYRGQRALTEDAHGFGIGLPVVRQIIEDFGGNITIVNYHKPTVFKIVLPLN